MGSHSSGAAKTQLPAPAQTELSGWGANLRSPCTFVRPETPDQVMTALDRSGTVARGLGRSYGDPALNAGGQVLGMEWVDRYLAFDPKSGTLICEAGVSLEQIIETFAPRGWFPAITPGTKFVTVGGCIANDIHGKAHHSQGCFSNCVDAMTVLLADGSVVTASPTENEELFRGCFGGMGLLGVILTATIRLRKIETTYFRQKSVAVENLAAMIAALDEHDQSFPYSVASIDITATGRNLGRGVLSLGEHANLAELPPALAKDPLRTAGPPKIAVPFELPELTLNRLSIRAVNALIQAMLRYAPQYGLYESFFYPLDKIAHWNRGYGRRGFTQYQFVIPLENGTERMHEILTAIISAGELPFLNILKRMGKQGPGLLSFPTEGYTLAIDFPIRSSTVELLRKLDAMVLDAGGRIYLGKDAYVTPEMFAKMYPDAIDRWFELKHRYDPDNVFTSDLGRRVGLVPAG
ncbi:MAG: FAD-binding oxidoreductase [Nannocystaceae bacterium]|nr:FAD-binding oxidoreductase [Nannocystaceae bacterium]